MIFAFADLDELWPGEHVTGSVLPANVAAVRKAVDAAEQSVETRCYAASSPVPE